MYPKKTLVTSGIVCEIVIIEAELVHAGPGGDLKNHPVTGGFPRGYIGI